MNDSTPKNHTWVETADGSHTLFSHQFQENCHSTSGAKEETVLHYLKGCQVEAKIQQKNITIFEVGFGLGLGFATTLEALTSSQNHFDFISVEIDRDLVLWTVLELTKKNILSEVEIRELTVEAKHLMGALTIILGDARNSLPAYLKTFHKKFDVIYQDAFSPKKNPTLWTTEWFELLRDASEDDVLMSTYSASSSIRKSMIAAGWKLHRGEKFGPKRTSTRASLVGETDPEILDHLNRSPVPALQDNNIVEYANEKQTL